MSAFEIHLRINNETDYSFSGSYSATSGKSLKFPTIQPGQTSEIISAKSKTLEGAEGKFHLTCNGDFEDPQDTKIVFSAGDPILGMNSFKLLKSSPFLKLKFRFGNGIPDGTTNWGSEAVPTSGHPLGIQMTISPQKQLSQLSLLTYNTHLFEGSIGGEVFHKQLVFRDDDRRGELIKRIREYQPDIVCLQEVWAIEMQKELAQELRQTYPHVYIVPDDGSHYFPLIDVKWPVDWALDRVTNTSGLMVASQYPIQNPRFEMYTGLYKSEVNSLLEKGLKNLNGNDLKVFQDSMAKKGALAFSISFPISASKSTTVNIGTTHCPTQIADAQMAVKTLARLTFGNGENDSIFAGDFNLHIKNTKEYSDLNGTMAHFCARDVVYEFLPHLEQSYTDWTGGNTLSKALGSAPGRDNKDRIDYIYFASGTKNHHLQPMNAEVFHDWQVDTKLDVSDHYPVYVKFNVNPS